LAHPNLTDVRHLLAERVTGINAESQRVIQNVVTDALGRGVSMDELAAELKGQFATWSDGRAMTIARTESAFAYSSASVVGYRQSGLIDRIMMFDNSAHDTDPQPPTMTTCADRDGRVVGLDEADAYIQSAHPNCVLAVSGILVGESV
jgi:hypothetical protein